jgi:hypothetical protein
MITIDEELLFGIIEDLPYGESLKKLILSTKVKDMIRPCEDCRYQKFSIFSGWKSVKDELPKESGSYIVCTDKSEPYMTHFYAGSNHWGGKRGDKHITHWLPRPLRPRWWENE